LIQNKSLAVATLPLVGFEFLENFIISVNEANSNLLKVKAEKKQTNYNSSGATWKSIHLNGLGDY
jgi:hypothetical protein